MNANEKNEQRESVRTPAEWCRDIRIEDLWDGYP